MTIYAVTGRPRTGTSMMMRALDEASDIEVYVDQMVDEDLNSMVPDLSVYSPNPNGYYNPPYSHRVGDKDNMLVKAQLMSHEWELAPPGEYMIVRMVRDELARSKSWVRSFAREEDPSWMARFEAMEAYLQTRRDFHVTIVMYEEMLSNPLREFHRIAEVGWPIDPLKAAYLIDPNLYRNR